MVVFNFWPSSSSPILNKLFEKVCEKNWWDQSSADFHYYVHPWYRTDYLWWSQASSEPNRHSWIPIRRVNECVCGRFGQDSQKNPLLCCFQRSDGFANLPTAFPRIYLQRWSISTFYLVNDLFWFFAQFLWGIDRVSELEQLCFGSGFWRGIQLILHWLNN